MTISLAHLSKRLRYAPDDGSFVWIASSKFRKLTGGAAGTINNHGYRVIKFEGRSYYAHRLAWLFTYGEWPSGEIDHINRNRLDNRIRNLRIATRTENLHNRVKSEGLSRFKGVTREMKNGRVQWRASIQHRNVSHRIGWFETEEAAAAAYDAAASRLAGEFAVLNLAHSFRLSSVGATDGA